MSSAYCLLYKLFTLKLTKKQVIGLITHADSPYIRGLGFMYIRYTQVNKIILVKLYMLFMSIYTFFLCSIWLKDCQVITFVICLIY